MTIAPTVAPPRIAIVVGSTRPGRRAPVVADWVAGHAGARDDATFAVVDLADHDLPFLDEPAPAIHGDYAHEHTRAWSRTIAAFDGFVFVTPEYNHATTAVLKNAIDYLFVEWSDRACGFVTYGVEGGHRAAESLRLIAGELRLADVRSHVALHLGVEVRNDGVVPGPRKVEKLTALFDEVIAWSGALRTLRGAHRAPRSGIARVPGASAR